LLVIDDIGIIVVDIGIDDVASNGRRSSLAVCELSALYGAHSILRRSVSANVSSKKFRVQHDK
jgi:hypothetical protein